MAADKKVIVEIEYDVDKAKKNVSSLTDEIFDLQKANTGLRTANKELSKQVKEASSDLKKSNEELKAEGKNRKDLQQIIQRNSKALKDNFQRTEANKDAIKRARRERTQSIKTITGEESAFDKLNKNLEENTEAQNKSTESAKKFSAHLDALPGGLGGAATGIATMTKAAIAFIATGIGAVIAAIGLAFGALVRHLKGSAEGQEKLNKITKIFGAIMSAIDKQVRKVGEILFEAFSKPRETIQQLGDLIQQNLLNRLKAFGVIGKSIVKIFSKDWKEGLKELGDGVLQFGTGVENLSGKVVDLFEKGREAASKLNEEIKKNIASAKILAEQENILTRELRNQERVQLEFQKLAEVQRQIRDDESRSIDERIAANEKLGKILKEQLETELSVAQRALKVANLRIKIEGETNENLDDRAEALTKIAEIEERITGQESEQLVNINSLLKERADIEKTNAEERKKIADEELERRGEAIAKLAELEQKRLEDEAATFEERKELQIARAEEELALKLEQDGILQEEVELAEAEHKARLLEIETQHQESVGNLRNQALNDARNSMQQIIAASQGMADKRVSIASDAFSKLATINFKEIKSAKSAFIQIGQAAQGLTSLITAGHDKELSNLQAQKQAELALAGDNAEQKEQIERKFNRKMVRLKKQQFQDEKNKNTIDAIIATALAVAKALGSSPPPLNFILAGVSGALGAAQVASIRRQPTPNFSSESFAQGGSIVDGPSHSQGGVNIYGDNGQHFGNVQGDEAMIVLKKEATAEIAAYSQLNESYGGRSLFNKSNKHFQEGGQIDTTETSIEKTVDEALKRTPIVVRVADIETGMTEFNETTEAAVI